MHIIYIQLHPLLRRNKFSRLSKKKWGADKSEYVRRERSQWKVTRSLMCDDMPFFFRTVCKNRRAEGLIAIEGVPVENEGDLFRWIESFEPRVTVDRPEVDTIALCSQKRMCTVRHWIIFISRRQCNWYPSSSSQTACLGWHRAEERNYSAGCDGTDWTDSASVHISWATAQVLLEKGKF